jgi:hypothetical protein
MLKLFKLAHNLEIAEIGYYPQVEISWPWSIDYWGERSFVNTPLSGSVREDVVFPRFNLASQAKANDWVGNGAALEISYLFVSTRLYELMRSFQMDNHQQFPVPVETSVDTLGYHLIYFLWPRSDDFIDWQNTIFQRTSASGETNLEQFNNTRERQFAKNNYELSMYQPGIHSEKITCDAFRFGGYDMGFYVSERLKNAMESAGMTGIVYEVPEWLPK